jgi:hypothetical protein
MIIICASKFKHGGNTKIEANQPIRKYATMACQMDITTISCYTERMKSICSILVVLKRRAKINYD